MSAEDDILERSAEDEFRRRETIAMIRMMGRIVVPERLYDKARRLFPEVADLIVKDERLPE